jgi:hypothetical protein
MNEREARLELEPDQQLLRDAWHSLAEALVIGAEQVEPMGGELPVNPDGPQPYTFTHNLDRVFAYNHLSDDKSLAMTSSEVSYSTPHKVELDDDEACDFVNIQWTAHMQGTPVSFRQSISVRRLIADDDRIDWFVGTVRSQYIQIQDDREEHVVSRAGFEYPDSNPTQEDMEHALQDHVDNARPISIDDIEAIMKVSEHIRTTATASRQ